jgi:hypothetical protein
MISNVTNTSAAAASTAASSSSTSSSAGQSSDVSTLDTPFGQLFVENLNSDNPEIVGYQAPNSQTVQTDYAAASASSSAAATEAAASDAASASTTPAASATAASSTTTSSTTTSSTTTSSDTATADTASANDTTASGAADPNSEPTAQSVFGDTPWETDAGGTGPSGPFNLNPMYFATQQTAQAVATMLGGTVVPVNTFALTPANPFSQNEPNEMVELSNGTMINPGLVAGFYTHGYQLSMIQQMIQNEVTNVAAEDGVTTT